MTAPAHVEQRNSAGSNTNIFLYTTMQNFPKGKRRLSPRNTASIYASSDDPFVLVSALAALTCGASLSPDALNAPGLFVAIACSPSPAAGLGLRAFGGSSGCSHWVLRVSWSMYTYCQIGDSGVSKRRAVNNHHTVSAQIRVPGLVLCGIFAPSWAAAGPCSNPCGAGTRVALRPWHPAPRHRGLDECSTPPGLSR
jgi:hypothetical protein